MDKETYFGASCPCIWNPPQKQRKISNKMINNNQYSRKEKLKKIKKRERERRIGI